MSAKLLLAFLTYFALMESTRCAPHHQLDWFGLEEQEGNKQEEYYHKHGHELENKNENKHEHHRRMHERFTNDGHEEFSDLEHEDDHQHEEEQQHAHQKRLAKRSSSEHEEHHHEHEHKRPNKRSFRCSSRCTEHREACSRTQKTYKNPCALACAGERLSHFGPCSGIRRA